MMGGRGHAVDCGTMLQDGRSQVVFLKRPLHFVNLPNPSSSTMGLGITQPLAEMSTRTLPWGGGGLKHGPHMKLTTSGPPRPITGIAFSFLSFFYFDF
jgi:hypothetical protein